MSKLLFYDNYFIYDTISVSIDELSSAITESQNLKEAEKLFGISRYIIKQVLAHYNLKFDYSSTPVEYNGDFATCKGKTINVNSIINYYITENHSKNETLEYFKLSNSFLSHIIKHYNIKKSRQLSNVHNKKTCLAKYGDATYNNHDKYKATMLSKYGVENGFQDQGIKNKISKTNIERYGVSSPIQSDKIKAKIQETCLQKYGVDWYSKTQEFLDKIKATNLKNGGAEFPMQREDVRKKFDFKAVATKSFKTKLKNGTTNTSAQEELLYNVLLEIFDKSDIYRNYNKDIRYPFHCDFYIKSLDLFIELNLYFTHGGHIFDINNVDDRLKLSDWQAKSVSSNFYKNAINVWTKLDPEKYNTAVKNNLKYLMIYNLQEFETLIVTITKYKNKFYLYLKEGD